MPIFFYICGIVTRIKFDKDSVNIQTHLKNRTRNLIIPYFIFGLILIIFYTFLDYQSGDYVKNFVSRISNLLYLRGIDSLWFIPIYFFSELVFILTIKKGKKNIYRILILLLITIICFHTHNNVVPQIKIISIGLVFIIAGYYHKNYFNKLPQIPILYFILIIVFFFGAILNGFSSMQKINNAILFFINGIGSSFAIISLFQILENKIEPIKRYILFWGTNTLIVLCTNNLIIEIVRLIDWKLTNNILLYNGYVGHLIFFLIITIIEIPVIKLLEDKF